MFPDRSCKVFLSCIYCYDLSPEYQLGKMCAVTFMTAKYVCGRLYKQWIVFMVQ